MLFNWKNINNSKFAINTFKEENSLWKCHFTNQRPYKSLKSQQSSKSKEIFMMLTELLTLENQTTVITKPEEKTKTKTLYRIHINRLKAESIFFAWWMSDQRIYNIKRCDTQMCILSNSIHLKFKAQFYC